MPPAHLERRERQNYVFASPTPHTYFGKNLEKAKFVAWMQNKFSTIL
jgi:hypothetical protein